MLRPERLDENSRRPARMHGRVGPDMVSSAGGSFAGHSGQRQVSGPSRVAACTPGSRPRGEERRSIGAASVGHLARSRQHHARSRTAQPTPLWVIAGALSGGSHRPMSGTVRQHYDGYNPDES